MFGDAPRLSMLLPTQYVVGVDNNDFTPVSFAQVKVIIEKQIEQSRKENNKIKIQYMSDCTWSSRRTADI